MSRSIPKEINEVLHEFVEGANNIFGDKLKKIILYGSYARGDFEKNSDIDIMFLTDLDGEVLNRKRMEIRDLACDMELEYDFVISPIVRNIDKYKARINVIPFYMNVQKEGVVLRG